MRVSFMAVWAFFIAMLAVASGQDRACKEYEQGTRAYGADQFDEAIGRFTQAIAADPKSQPHKMCDGLFPGEYAPYYFLGVSYFRKGDFDKAKDSFKRENRQALTRETLRRLEEVEAKLSVEARDGVRWRTTDVGDFREIDEVTVNNVVTKVGYIEEATQTVRFLGDGHSWRDGVNYIVGKGDQLKLWWLENGVLSRFEAPYKKSYAIVVAVGDLQRPTIEFPPVPGMVDRARDLAALLPTVGFPPGNIITLFDREATSARVDAELRKFWHGGEHQDADRLFVYFGGHGTVVSPEDAKDSAERARPSGALVTYDYDSRRPALTSVLMDMLTEIHAPQMAAHHLLIALDSCHAGLARPRMLAGESSPDQLRKIRTLSVIRANLDKSARQVLLAGTGEERALYLTGGVFTAALIDALKGAADRNENGVIEFDELASYVRNEVIVRAIMKRVDQRPDSGSLSGSGRFMFIKSRR